MNKRENVIDVFIEFRWATVFNLRLVRENIYPEKKVLDGMNDLFLGYGPKSFLFRVFL